MQLHPDHVEVFTESPADPDEPASNRRKTFLENSRKLDQSSTGLKERRAEEQVFEKEVATQAARADMAAEDGETAK
jgi:hypothetical protein